jgi:uncharacterized protein (DUF1778 family)
MAERTQRLHVRLTASNRKLIERAASLLGQPLTAFAVRVLVEHAEQVISQDTQRKRSARDWKRFLERRSATGSARSAPDGAHFFSLPNIAMNASPSCFFSASVSFASPCIAT